MATFDSGKSLEKEVLQLFKLVQKMRTELANVRQLKNLALKLNIQAHDSILLPWKMRRRRYLMPAMLIKLQANVLRISSKQLTRLRGH